MLWYCIRYILTYVPDYHQWRSKEGWGGQSAPAPRSYLRLSRGGKRPDRQKV